MGFSSGYSRQVWVSKDLSWPIWVKRARCRRCGSRPALLPSFCLPHRRYAVGVIGSAVEAHVGGASLRAVAARAELNEPAVRLWCHRFAERAELARAVVAGIAAGLGGQASIAAGSVEAAVLAALQAAVAGRGETQRLPRWSAISVLTGGMWLAPVKVTNAPPTRVFSAAEEERLMSLVDTNDGKRPP